MKKTLLLLCWLPVTLLAQSAKETADDHLNNSRWPEAVTAYQQYLKSNPSDSAAWFSLGRAQMESKDFDESLASLAQAARTNFNPAFIGFSQAKVYALKGDAKNVVTVLAEAAANGLAAYTQLLKESAFDPYRGEEAFQKALAQVELNAYPCLSDANARHFDFWLGEWEVHAQGQVVGENHISRAVGGCAIHEHYTTPRNYAGQSINFYDPVDKKWHQHWVGSGGDIYNFMEVDKAEGMLQFQSKYLNPAGQINWMRMTFTKNDDGSVRQLMENSGDEGTTWTTAFDGLYKKKSD